MWLKVIGVALVVAIVLRVVAVEAFRIPSSSMEQTLLVGDVLFVSKLHYGARLPRSLGIPFTDRYLEPFIATSFRLPGFSEVSRGDVVVFNYPPEPRVLEQKGTYIKRVVGLPGDTVAILSKVVSVNGDVLDLPPQARQRWRVELDGDFNGGEALPAEVLHAFGAQISEDPTDRQLLLDGTAADAQQLARFEGVLRVTPLVRQSDDRSAAFPATPAYSLDTYGPVAVPGRGLTVHLNSRTWPLYRDAISAEALSARRVAGEYEINGLVSERYTFQQDYYFVLGDNRDDSADSRTWGFVPESHLVGKATLVYFSWDSQRRAPRWERLFTPVK